VALPRVSRSDRHTVVLSLTAADGCCGLAKHAGKVHYLIISYYLIMDVHRDATRR